MLQLCTTFSWLASACSRFSSMQTSFFPWCTLHVLLMSQLADDSLPGVKFWNLEPSSALEVSASSDMKNCMRPPRPPTPRGRNALPEISGRTLGLGCALSSGWSPRLRPETLTPIPANLKQTHKASLASISCHYKWPGDRVPAC